MVKALYFALFTAALAGCSAGRHQTTFEWFNLSTNEIWVTEIIGLTPGATPGRLVPSTDEGRLNVSALTFQQELRIQNSFSVRWADNGNIGWPGGRTSWASPPPGTAHEVAFKRDDLGLPARERNATIRLTYLGKEKWRIRRVN